MFIDVYRIEKPDQTGPYCHGSSWRDRIRAHDLSDKAPSPYYDDLTDYRSDDHFGFISLQQLSKWFWLETEVKKLRVLGYQITVYRIHENLVKMGNSQVAFPIKAAEAVQYLDIVMALSPKKHTGEVLRTVVY